MYKYTYIVILLISKLDNFIFLGLPLNLKPWVVTAIPK